MAAPGDKYGRWVVLSFDSFYTPPSGGSRIKRWKCQCRCGEIKSVLQNSLHSGTSLSCGCLTLDKLPCNRETARGLRVGCDRTHPCYNVWSLMIQRCYEENHDSYFRYGGRGITVCDRWLENFGQGFRNFVEDMGERPDKGSLDRIDNNGSYTPENCRWASSTDQMRNRSLNKNNTSGKTGVVWSNTMENWCAQICVNYKNIVIGYYSDFEEAVQARKEAELKYFGRYSNS